jgi:hypothetical protein
VPQARLEECPDCGQIVARVKPDLVLHLRLEILPACPPPDYEPPPEPGHSSVGGLRSR